MSEGTDDLEAQGGTPESGPESGPDTGTGGRWRWIKLGLAVLATPFLLLLLAYGCLSTPIGKRVVADQVAGYQTETGLSIAIGRIEGDLFGKAQLYDLEVRDPKGAFITIPEVTLDWRPIAWLWNGLDIREIIARRGRMERRPELLEGDPDAPILPDFDIRIDRLEIDNLTIAAGVATDEAQRVNLIGKADIRTGRALVEARGRLGDRDRIALLLDVEPDRDKFDLALDYLAPAGGVIAGLAGTSEGYQAKIAGDGSWRSWLGHALVLRLPAAGDTAKERVAAFELANVKGTYSLIGQLFPGLEPGTLLGRLAGSTVSLFARGTFEDNTFDGNLRTITDRIEARGEGAIDLGESRFEDFDLAARLRDPEAFADGVLSEDTRLTGVLDGTFGDLALDHELTIARLETAIFEASDISQSGTAKYDGRTFSVPLSITLAQLVTGSEYADPSLKNGTLSGLLTYRDTQLAIDEGVARFPDAAADFALRGDTATGTFGVAGPVTVRGVDVGGFGTLSAQAALVARFGTSIPWNVEARLIGKLADVRNQTVADIAGNTLDFRANMELAANQPINLRNVVLDSERLDARFNSRVIPGSGGTRTTLAGTGEHVRYGSFTFDAELTGAGPRATLVLASPYPTAGLKDVRVTLAPSDPGFAIDVAGQSMLGEFNGALGLELPPDAPTRIDVTRLTVHRTQVSGELTLSNEVLSGMLAVEGGGLNGSLTLMRAGKDAQGFELSLKARRAAFGGATPITLGNADIFAAGNFGDPGSEIFADIAGTGLEYGDLRVANFAAKAAIQDGEGTVRGTLAGRRADRFLVKFDADLKPRRIELLARGSYGGRSITMPRRAILTARKQGGYDLAPAQISYARGYAIVEGVVGGDATDLEFKLANMPLRLADLAGSDLALGGLISGIVNYQVGASGTPSGDARIKIDNFTRSGLLLSSQPIDISAVIDLSPERLTAAAALANDGRKLGRVDARITRLGPGSDLRRRIMRGRLNAKLTFDGAAEALWRLMAIETFDLTGPVAVDATATGTLENPRLGGTLSSDRLRLQSAVTGSDISGIAARGRFAGSKLQLTRFSGSTDGGGTITGSGSIDLARISETRGPGIDLRAAVRNSRILNAAGLDATLTGPLRIVSNGVGGTIAGRVTIDRASWRLGRAEQDLSLPRIRTTEINRLDSANQGERNVNKGEWRYAVTAKSQRGIAVNGLGLSSQWGANIVLTGTVNDPRLSGNAFLDRGTYTFAGSRFNLTRGRITFNPNEPINPQLDIAAQTSRGGTNVQVAITGNSDRPSVTLSSNPALPEEEILAQLLFGGSVTNLSATDAAQLAAALSALQGGKGIDPIGDLRRQIGLDQLRIVAADPLTGQRTGVALGKYLGNRFYVELITDGQGYSATRIEYRITSWLALLGQVSTIGRDSVLAEISHDY